jgi:hypothetical protein
MRIKIAEKNVAKIEAALAAANGKANAHTFTSYADVAKIAATAEADIGRLGLPMSHRSGARFASTSGSAVANRYKYTRQGTTITIERGSSAWYLINVRSATLWAGGGRDQTLLSQAQDAYLRALPCGYLVYTPAVAEQPITQTQEVA